jgi:hypothetical protein
LDLINKFLRVLEGSEEVKKGFREMRATGGCEIPDGELNPLNQIGETPCSQQTPGLPDTNRSHRPHQQGRLFLIHFSLTF